MNSTSSGCVLIPSKSARASSNRPCVKRSSPTSRRTRSISSARTVRKRSTVRGLPSSSVTPWWIHCQAMEREISTVAASSMRLYSGTHP